MGILLSAMAAAGDSGVQSINQNITQQNTEDLEQQRSDLAAQKAQSLTDYQIAAKMAADDQERSQQAARIQSAITPSLQSAIIQNAQADPNNTWVPANTVLNSDGTAPAGTATIAPSLSDLSPADLQQYAPTAGQRAQAYVDAASATGDISPATVADLAMKDIQAQRAEAAQAAQFNHSDASQAAAQNFQASQAATARTFQAGENSKNRDAMSDRIDAQAAAAAPPDDLTQSQKDLWLHQYVVSNGSIPRSAPSWVKNNIGTWAAEKGITPDDLATGAAQTKFDMSSAMTAGHRSGTMAGVEAAMPALASNAVGMSQKVGQGNFVPLNKLSQMADTAISDPNLAAFKVANQALASEYQQVISRGGTNVAALKEAMNVLNSAQSPDAYAAAVNQVLNEVKVNSSAMKAVRGGLGPASNYSAPLPLTTANPTQSQGLPDGWSVRIH